MRERKRETKKSGFLKEMGLQLAPEDLDTFDSLDAIWKIVLRFGALACKGSAEYHLRWAVPSSCVGETVSTRNRWSRTQGM